MSYADSQQKYYYLFQLIPLFERLYCCIQFHAESQNRTFCLIGEYHVHFVEVYNKLPIKEIHVSFIYYIKVRSL